MPLLPINKRWMTWPKARLRSIAEISLMLSCFAMPIHNQWVVPPLAIAIMCFLLAGEWEGIGAKVGLLALPMVYFLLYTSGMLQTTDTAFGWFDLQIKVSLFLFPLAVLVSRPVANEFLRKCLMALTIGLFVGIAISCCTALTCYVEHGWIQCFTASYLSTFIHPSYQAWFAVWAISYWGLEMVRGKVRGSMRSLLLIALLLLLVYVVMLSSKTGWICLIVAFLVLLFVAFRSMDAGQRNKLLIASLVILLIPSVLLRKVITDRTMEVVNSVQTMYTEGMDAVAGSETSSAERLVAWGCSTQLITAEPLGVGTGDIKNELIACYEQHNAQFAVERRLNSHSQLLQSGVALGWPGIIMFLIFLLLPLYLGIKERDLSLILFMLFFIVNSLVESVLEVQAGVVFVSLFFSLMVVRGVDQSSSMSG